MLGLCKPYQTDAGVLAGLLLARLRSSSTQVHLLTLQASITGSEARRLAFGRPSTNQGHALRLTEPQKAKRGRLRAYCSRCGMRCGAAWWLS